MVPPVGLDADHRCSIEVPERFDLAATLGAWRQGALDPSVRIVPGRVDLAASAPAGPVAVRLQAAGTSVDAWAWGPGAGVIDTLLPDLVGAHDDVSTHRPDHRLLAELARRFAGQRFARGRAVVDAVLPVILGQRVTTAEAMWSYRAIVERYGLPAPGPLGLVVPPGADVLRQVAYHELHPLGVDGHRARLIATVAARAGRLQEVEHDSAELQRRLRSIPGVGPWTATNVAQVVCGDADAAIVGDLHLPGVVGWSLAREAGADDRRMLELLEPFAGHRARVQRHLVLAGARAPSRAPRARIMDHRRR